MKNKALQSGMTLVEIMVALLIGIFLLAGVLQTFVGSKQTNRLLEELARIQENGRYAIDLLATDIRMAGFIGCTRSGAITNSLNPIAAPNDFLYNFTTPIEGFEATSPAAWTPAINPLILLPVGGSDVIAIRRAENSYSFPITSHPAPNGAIILDATATDANLKGADFLKSDGTNYCATAVISNCSTAAFFQITGVAGNSIAHNTGACAPGPGNSTDNLSTSSVLPLTPFPIGSIVSPINTKIYYIRLNDQNNQPTLYRKVGFKAAEALVEGIEQMQILYGVDRDCGVTTPCNTADFYVTADQLAGLAATDKIISVRISLLAVSSEAVTSGPTQVIYNGNFFPTNDGLLRRVFTSTISIRN